MELLWDGVSETLVTLTLHDLTSHLTMTSLEKLFNVSMMIQHLVYVDPLQ